MLQCDTGSVNAQITPLGKPFAGCLALYAGLEIIVQAALIFMPILHRVLHTFHRDSAH